LVLLAYTLYAVAIVNGANIHNTPTMQKFIARESIEYKNGAIGWRPGGPFDCLGPWAKVQNCPIEGTDIRRTAYATGHADTFFSIPAVTRYKGKRITGFFTMDGDNPIFCPHESQLAKLA
jgi:hypothetical protein